MERGTVFRRMQVAAPRVVPEFSERFADASGIDLPAIKLRRQQNVAVTDALHEAGGVEKMPAAQADERIDRDEIRQRPQGRNALAHRLDHLREAGTMGFRDGGLGCVHGFRDSLRKGWIAQTAATARLARVLK